VKRLAQEQNPTHQKQVIEKQMDFGAALQALQATQTQLLNHARKKAVPQPQVQWLQ